MALAFLVHFVGDLHQPMHAGDHADLGGNKVAANYGVIGGRANLHSIWDGWLAERAITTPPAGPRGLLGTGSAGRAQAHRRRKRRGLEPRDVGQGARPCLCDDGRRSVRRRCRPTRPTLDEAEVRALIPAVREKSLAGGIRLARLLDDALGPEAQGAGTERR